MSVCCKSLPPIQTKREICVQCVYLSCLKKKETERKWKGSLSLSFVKPSSVHAVILLTF